MPHKLYTGTGNNGSPDRHDSAGPFVTTVGGTTGIPPASEVGFSLSGGGFSQIFDTPDFQKIEVGDYIKSIKDTHINRYQFVLSSCLAWPIITMLLRCLHRPTGRAIPDIALASSRYTYIAGGKEVQMDSTSCSLSVRLTLVPPLCFAHPRAPG